MTLKSLYEISCRELKNAGIEEYKSETEYILEKLFGFTKLKVILGGNDLISAQDKDKLLKILNKRKSGIPVQYILGEWEFMGLEFNVGPGVLIPRDDTTVLVEESYKYVCELKSPKIIDLCSGTGCIAITLDKILKNCPEIFAVEKSDEAFKYMVKNIARHNSNVKGINFDIFDIYFKVKDNFFDAIISNPPYIRSCDMSALQEEVKKEPEMALNGGQDGLYFYRKILECWTSKLKFGGIMAFEIGVNQSQQVVEILKNYHFKNIKVIKDIGGIERVVTGIK